MKQYCNTTQLLDLGGSNPLALSSLDTLPDPIGSSDLLLAERANNFYRLSITDLATKVVAAAGGLATLGIDGRLPIAQAPKGLARVRNVLDYPSWQAAADSLPTRGGRLYIPGLEGNSTPYALSSSLLLRSGTRLVGDGPASRIILAPSYVVTPSPGIPGLPSFATMITNQNNGAATITDQDISIENLAFGPLSGVIGCGGVLMRKVKNVHVLNCVTYNMNDQTQFLASSDILITGCYAENTPNATWDFWEGNINCTVRDCTVKGCATGYGVSFNTVSTNGLNLGPSHGLIVDGVRVYDAYGGIYVGPVGNGECYDAKITNCYLDNATVLVKGSARVQVKGCTFYGFTNKPTMIFVVEETNLAACDDAIVKDNYFVNCNVGAANSYIYHIGERGSITGNKAINSTAGTGIYAGVSSTVCEFNQMTGATVQYGGVAAALIIKDDGTGGWNSSAPLARSYVQPLGSGTIAFNMNYQYATLDISNTGVAIDTAINVAANHKIEVRIKNTGNVLAPIYYSGAAAALWRWITAKPTGLAPNKTLILTLTAYGLNPIDITSSLSTEV